MTARVPFRYIIGPNYVYIIRAWVGSDLEPIYVGRGTGRRGRDYYNIRRHAEAPTHHRELTKRIADVRSRGQDVTIRAYECGNSLSRAKRKEIKFIAKFGRRDIGTGTLYNLNRGG